MPASTPVTDEDYARLLALRTRLRAFERWSADQARRSGLTPSQHQLLLAVRGHDDPAGPTIGELADYLFVRHNTVVELVDRAESLGLVRRVTDTTDRRVVRLQLADDGRLRLAALAAAHKAELHRLVPVMKALTRGAAT